METQTLTLSEENKKKLEYIQRQTQQDLQTSLAMAIDFYFQKLHNAKDPLARLRSSPLIGSVHGDPNLSQDAEKIFRDLLDKK